MVEILHGEAVLVFGRAWAKAMSYIDSMKKVGWFLLGAASLLAVQTLVAAIVLRRAHGWSAQEEPMGVERWLARRVHEAAIPAEAKNRTNPAPNTPEVLSEARAHWADHCASCHGNDGRGNAGMGAQMYPPTPDMRTQLTQSLSDGELFYIIQNGVRLTGMPAWGASGHDAEDSWKLVRFIRRLPDLTPEERKQMEELNPKGPDEWREQEEEEKFLKGGNTDARQPHHHH